MTTTELAAFWQEVKKCVNHADEMMLMAVYVMLGENQNPGWWNKLPENIKADITESLSQAKKGEIRTYEQVKERYPEWVALCD